MLAAIATLLLAVNTTPVPKVTGPIPVTADSYPFLAANKSTPAFDLSKVGYVEEEYIVSGNANVYDWAADGSLNVKTPNAPYGTRRRSVAASPPETPLTVPIKPPNTMALRGLLRPIIFATKGVPIMTMTALNTPVAIESAITGEDAPIAAPVTGPTM